MDLCFEVEGYLDRKPAATAVSAPSFALSATHRASHAKKESRLGETNAGGGFPVLDLSTPEEAFSTITNLFASRPRRVCQHPFRRNDIVWVCRTCQADETCVLCHDCYRRSDHEGHDVAFYHAQAGGCCDCGDPDAWDPAGFCDIHGDQGGGGGFASSDGGSSKSDMEMLACADGVVRAVVEYLVSVAGEVSESFVKKPVMVGDSGQVALSDDENGGIGGEKGFSGRRRRSGSPMPSSSDVDEDDSDFVGMMARDLAAARSRSAARDEMGRGGGDESGNGRRWSRSSDGDEFQSRLQPLSSDEIMQDLRDARLGGGDVGNIFDDDDDEEDESNAFGTPLQSIEHQLTQEDTDEEDIEAGAAAAAAAASVTAGNENVMMETSDDEDNHVDAAVARGGGGGVSGSMTSSSQSSIGQDVDFLSSTDGNDDIARLGSSLRLKRQTLIDEARNESRRQRNASATSSGASRSGTTSPSSFPTTDRALRIALKGRDEGGLFLILHSDDVHDLNSPAMLQPSSASGDSSNPLAGDFMALSRLFGSGGGPGGTSSSSSTPTLRVTLLNRILRLAKHHGELCLLGTSELLSELGVITGTCWRDGDMVSTKRVGKWILHRAKFLARRNWPVSIKTHSQMEREQRAAGCIHLLSVLARSCDAMCGMVADAIKGKEHLVPLLRTDLKLPRVITKKWHSLLLTLLAVPKFKMELAVAYCDTYGMVTREYAGGAGISDCSSFTLSVQFLNRQTYVRELAANRKLLSRLTKALLATLEVALVTDESNSLSRRRPHGSGRGIGSSSLSTSSRVGVGVSGVGGIGGRGSIILPAKVLNPLHPVLSHRRYSPCISDLKCVLNVAGMSRQFSTVCLDTWIDTLALSQGMDKQAWRSWNEGHVETEPRGWVGAFNCSISLGSLFERVLAWEDSDEGSPIEQSPVGGGGGVVDGKKRSLFTCAEITRKVLVGVDRWQQHEILRFQTTTNSSTLSSHERCPASLPYSTVHVRHGTHLCQPALPISQAQPWSFHYPLHRFLAVCLRELARRRLENDGDANEHGQQQRRQLALSLHAWTQMIRSLDGKSLRCLLEFPTLALSRAAQIRSGLWKRNGPGMQDQVLNYAEPPFCRSLRDADLTLLQFATLGLNGSYLDECDASMEKKSGPERGGDCGTAYIVNLLLHRFGVFDFVGFVKGPNSSCSRYIREVREGLYNGEVDILEDDGDDNDDNSERMSLSFSMNVHQMEDEEMDGDAGGDPPIGMQEIILPWTYSPARGDAVSCLSLLEELLHLIIVLITELPSPPPSSSSSSGCSQIAHAKRRLRREVIHRLTSGPKTHSELAEVHHVLPQRDNSALSEEGKVVNPDDAGGAALEATLEDVADRKPSRGLAPDQWFLRKEVWEEYDPAFYHVGARAHQSAAENRPKPSKAKPPTGAALDGVAVEVQQQGQGHVSPPSYPYAPRPAPAHDVTKRLRRDFTADAAVVALVYKTLYIHCANDKSSHSRRGKSSYDKEALSETALARAVHVLTLGAYSWEEEDEKEKERHDGSGRRRRRKWRGQGGGGVGSVFFSMLSDDNDGDDVDGPSAREWINAVLLSGHSNDNDKNKDDLYSNREGGDENALILLHRLAVKGTGRNGGFVAQDSSVRSGAAWLCSYAAKYSPEASRSLNLLRGVGNTHGVDGSVKDGQGLEIHGGGGMKSICGGGGASDMDRRRMEARERTLKMMNAMKAKFVASMEGSSEQLEDDDDYEDNSAKGGTSKACSAATSPTITSNLANSPPVSTLSEFKNDHDDNDVADEAMEDVTCTTPNGKASKQQEQQQQQRPQQHNDEEQEEDSSLFFSHLDSPPRKREIDGGRKKPPVASLSSSLSSSVGLLKERPRCIICADDDGVADSIDYDGMGDIDDSFSREKGGKTNKRLPNRALAFCGHAQASTVLKGAGGPLWSNESSSSFDCSSQVNRFVGVHVALCGHAVHASCCDSYLASVAQRDNTLADRLEANGGSLKKGGEFRCPLCQRLSNCLVPFIDVESDWIESPQATASAAAALTTSSSSLSSSSSKRYSPGDHQGFHINNGNWAINDDDDCAMDETDNNNASTVLSSSPSPHGESKDERRQRHYQHYHLLHTFLSKSIWIKPDSPSEWWDGRCSFVRLEESSSSDSDGGGSFSVSVSASGVSGDRKKDGSCSSLSVGGEHTPNNRRTSSASSSSSERIRGAMRTGMAKCSSFGRKDLLNAWTVVMKTPRFRKKSSSRRRGSSSSSNSRSGRRRGGGGRGSFASMEQQQQQHSSHSSSGGGGGVEVWGRLMDTIAHVSSRADMKRLGGGGVGGGVDDGGSGGSNKEFGEFRHYFLESAVYNAADNNNLDQSVGSGRSFIDNWPQCVFSSIRSSPSAAIALSESRQNEMEKERLVSKLLYTIQSFTYSCCSEASEVRRLERKAYLLECKGDDEGATLKRKSFYPKFGVEDVKCDGLLVCLPRPSKMMEENNGGGSGTGCVGEQIFEGRLGRLRYFGLAIMSAASPLSREIVQLAFSFYRSDVGVGVGFERAIHNNNDGNASGTTMTLDPPPRLHHQQHPARAPIAYPILCGHVLTHTVAAMSAVCGRGRALNLLNATSASNDSNNLNVIVDCENFIKLGLLARILQVLLGCLDLFGLGGNGKNGRKGKDVAMEVNEVDVMSYLDLVDDVLCQLDGRNYSQEEKSRTPEGKVGYDDDDDECWMEKGWMRVCCKMLEAAMEKSCDRKPAAAVAEASSSSAQAFPGVKKKNKKKNEENKQFDRYVDACVTARLAGESFLADAALILQIMAPAVVSEEKRGECSATATGKHISSSSSQGAYASTLAKLAKWIKMECILEMLNSPCTRDVLAWWYEDATGTGRAFKGKRRRSGSSRNRSKASPSSSQMDEQDDDDEEKLSFKREFHVRDWPINMMKSIQEQELSSGKNLNEEGQFAFSFVRARALLSSPLLPTWGSMDTTSTSQHIRNTPISGITGAKEGNFSFAQSPSSLLSSPSSSTQSSSIVVPLKHMMKNKPPSYSTKKCVPLLCGFYATSFMEDEMKKQHCTTTMALTSNEGGTATTSISRTNSVPRILVLPTSYTDLYAQLGALCPDSDQTALCLVCGAVLNAGGKGECTKHARKCGGGCGLFFLLQECAGLIVHGGRAAYVHSPYVDSHGETPQYRGRPLNLDLDRYDILHEMYSGHLVRERVIAERASSRQVIIANFY